MNKKLRVAGFGLLLGASAFGLSGCTSPFGQTVAQPEKPQTAIVDYEIIVNQHPKVAEAKAKMEKDDSRRTRKAFSRRSTEAHCRNAEDDFR